MEKFLFSKPFTEQLAQAGYPIQDLTQEAQKSPKPTRVIRQWTGLPNETIRNGFYQTDREELLPKIQQAITTILEPWLNKPIPGQSDLPPLQVLQLTRQTDLSSEKICRLLKDYPLKFTYNQQELTTNISPIPKPSRPMVKNPNPLTINNASEFNSNPKKIIQKARQLRWQPGSRTIQAAKLQWDRVDMLIRKEAANRAKVSFTALTNNNNEPTDSKRNTSNRKQTNSEVIKSTDFLYNFLTEKNNYQRNNQLNNQLLKSVATATVQTGKLSLWRFICMPEISLETQNNQFKKWQYTFGSRRYDTLTPALPRDQQLIDGLKDRGINSELYFVIDDWEAPYLRTAKEFYSLPKDEKRKALEGLEPVRQQTSQWIYNTTNNTNLEPKDILYFSSRIEFPEFVDLMDAIPLELEPKYSGIYQEEQRFVQKSSPELSLLEKDLKAARRIAQYAVEGSIIIESGLTNGLYLNSEYPVQQVWKKLTLLSPDIPTLFYVKDEEVKNI